MNLVEIVHSYVLRGLAFYFVSHSDRQWSNFVGMDDPETILRPLANHVRPMLLNSWKERRKVAFTDNAQRMKRVLDNLQRKIDEVSEPFGML